MRPVQPCNIALDRPGKAILKVSSKFLRVEMAVAVKNKIMSFSSLNVVDELFYQIS